MSVFCVLIPSHITLSSSALSLVDRSALSKHELMCVPKRPTREHVLTSPGSLEKARGGRQGADRERPAVCCSNGRALFALYVRRCRVSSVKHKFRYWLLFVEFVGESQPVLKIDRHGIGCRIWPIFSKLTPKAILICKVRCCGCASCRIDNIGYVC